jgi:hypothetical protein
MLTSRQKMSPSANALGDEIKPGNSSTWQVKTAGPTPHDKIVFLIIILNKPIPAGRSFHLRGIIIA